MIITEAVIMVDTMEVITMMATMAVGTVTARLHLVGTEVSVA